MASADPEQRSLIAAIGASTQLAELDAEGLIARTAPARRARWQKYLDRVNPAITDPADRERAARHLLRADMQRLALLAVQARKELAELATAGERAS